MITIEGSRVMRLLDFTLPNERWLSAHVRVRAARWRRKHVTLRDIRRIRFATERVKMWSLTYREHEASITDPYALLAALERRSQ